MLTFTIPGRDDRPANAGADKSHRDWTVGGQLVARQPNFSSDPGRMNCLQTASIVEAQIAYSFRVESQTDGKTQHDRVVL